MGRERERETVKKTKYTSTNSMINMGTGDDKKKTTNAKKAKTICLNTFPLNIILSKGPKRFSNRKYYREF